ncbi:MAG: PEP/pyruvate-binding domain-containing protein, partial [Anaerolineae bacterium]|nr:PEP/pyruvate-binding domain-containing protein [Anaerolineae bacterium]
LNVQGEPALIQAVIRCWSSLWTPRAIGYRRSHGVGQEVALAVVVQAMVAAEAAGVLFTANPVTGLRTETVIDATLGLGEALVSGLVEPDHYVVDMTARRIVTKRLGAKALVVREATTGGVYQEAMTAADRQALPDPIILELADLGRRVASLYAGEPQDIEWAWAGDRLYLLQTRPITTLYPLPDDLPAEPLFVLGSLGAVQGVLDPLTPLGRETLVSIFLALLRRLGWRETPTSSRIAYVAGERLFANLTGLIRHPRGRPLLRAALGAIEPGMARLLEPVLDDPRLAVRPIVHPRPRTVLRMAGLLAPIALRFLWTLAAPAHNRRCLWRDIQQGLEFWGSRSREASTLADVLSLSERMTRQFVPYILPRIGPRLAAGLVALNLLLRLARTVPDGRRLVLEAMRGLPYNVTTEMDLALWAAARELGRDPEAVALLREETANGLAQRYLEGTLPPTLQTTVAAFLAHYGARGLVEIDIGRPRWREDPRPVFQNLQNYLRITDPAAAPDLVFAHGAEAAAIAITRLAEALRTQPRGWFKARLARWAAGRMRALMGLREMPKWTLVQFMGFLREGFLAQGREWAARGVLNAAEDIFFLQRRELAVLAAGEGTATAWADVVRERRRRYDREKRRRQVPRLLLSDGRAFYEGLSPAAETAGDVIVGSPVSPGVVEGRVRVVFDPHHADLHPGEIMVCPGTDPSWTPLFLVAGGLIMEVGGMMTHGAVVAREYGIPAVVGVHQATARFQTGQRVRLDGATGLITVVPADSSELPPAPP